MVRASKKTITKNRDLKKNLTLDQIKYLTGLNLWNYGGICKAMMIRKLKQRKETMPKKKTTKKKQPNILKGLKIEVLADNKKDKQEFQKGLNQFLLKKYQQGYFN